MTPLFTITRTRKFHICEYVTIVGVEDGSTDERVLVICDLNCEYSQLILCSSIAKRKWCKVCLELPLQTVNKKIIQFRDFENIEWDRVMAGEHIASSYLIRKGKYSNK